jgi:REP element-mobilizing transposase RayT
MPQRGEVFAAGEYYHIYNRGAGRTPIFFTPANYEYCLRLVKRYLTHYAVTVIAYCLIPNHYHFLLRQDSDLPLSKFIGVLFNAYAQAVNKQQARSGSLFEGRFRHCWIDREEYLTHLCRYIHLNPVKAQLVRRPEDWPYSNYQDWLGLRSGVLKDQAFIQAHFLSGEVYRQFVADWQNAEQMQTKLRSYVFD